jgi:hypothetical protein
LTTTIIRNSTKTGFHPIFKNHILKNWRDPNRGLNTPKRENLVHVQLKRSIDRVISTYLQSSLLLLFCHQTTLRKAGQERFCFLQQLSLPSCLNQMLGDFQLTSYGIHWSTVILHVSLNVCLPYRHAFRTINIKRQSFFFRKGNKLISQLLHRLMHIAVRYYKHQNKGPRNLKNKVLRQSGRR